MGTTIVFIGMMISSTFWGKISDRFGRKQALIVSGIFLFFYGFLSTFSPSYPWILCLRFMVGFNIGCVPQSVTLYAEFLPTKQRGKCVVLLGCFWLPESPRFMAASGNSEQALSPLTRVA